jgi:hypothetical protein
MTTAVTFANWNDELLKKWINFLKFLLDEGPGVLRDKTSPVHKGLLLPELSLSIFMENIKNKRHFLPESVSRIHECSERWLQHSDKERIIFVDTLTQLTLKDKTALLGIEGEDTVKANQITTGLLQWVKDCPDTGLVHKFCRYLDFFDMVADHTSCCKPKKVRKTNNKIKKT